MLTILSNINAYILTGGQSRRLNTDKSLVQLSGETLTEIIHQNLSSTFNNIYIVGKENHFPNFNFIKDVKPVQCPLNGIVTALEHNKKGWIFVIACDLPLIRTSSINNLYDNINSNTQVVVPIVDDNIQPLCAFYHNSVLERFKIAINRGDYSLMKLLNNTDVFKIKVPIRDKEQFLNINYPDDLKKAEELLKIENK